MTITCEKPVTRLSFYASSGHGLKKRDPVAIHLWSANSMWIHLNRVQEVYGDLVLLEWEMDVNPVPGAKINICKEVKA